MDRRLGRLLKKADAVALRADKLVSAALRAVRGEMALLAGELNLGGSADDRATAEDAIRRRLATLSRRLDRLLDAQNRLAAKSAVRDASDLSGLEIRYSASRAEAVCQIVTPAQGDSLAAVLTDRMAQSLVNALRSATVAALRDNALAGGPLRELGRDILDRWQAAAAEKPVFTDSSGRTWDTARYIQMNARTNSMRVYNDCLADALARSGSDLVRVSRGGNPTCDGCFPWEGAILSLSGKTDGFPTYEQARASGCFHPNCTHTLDYVDETADADEIALQRAHPVGKPDADGAFDFDTADERRYEIDVDRKMREDSSLSREAAETAVNRDNLAANIRSGLVRADAADLVAELSDAQIAALCPDGNPPKFAPVKRVRGGTRENPKFEPERWRRGSRGGTVHIDRNTTADHLAQVAKLDEAKDATAKPSTPKDWEPSTPLEKSTDALMRSIGAIHTNKPLNIEDVNPNYSKGPEWRKNCQRCVPAYEARCRGYDVTAISSESDKYGLNLSHHSTAMWKNEKKVFFSARNFKQGVENALREFGDGARAELRIGWKGRHYGHVFTAIQKNGIAQFYDPQNPNADATLYFSRAATHGRNARHWLLRIDNNEFTDEAKRCFSSRA